MKVYHYDQSGVYAGSSDARTDPLETKNQKQTVYLLPARATFLEPPIPTEGTRRVFANGKWEIQEIPKEEKPPEPEPETEEQKAERERNELIYAEMTAILRDMAIKSLIEKGVLKE